MAKKILFLFLTSFLLWANQPPPPPEGLPPVPWPADNPYSAEKVELGRLLYFDKRLSANGTVACATCHNPALAFGDDRPVAVGIDGKKGTRNAPTVINSAYNGLQFWDGRAATLEEQAEGPIANPNEMADTTSPKEAHKICVERLKQIAGYRDLFKQVFGTENFTIKEVTMAIASFERTILSGDSPYDRYEAGDKYALSPSQVAGMKLFFGKAHCSICHTPPNFTDNGFANIGVGMKSKNPDLGRYLITGREADKGAFKVPTLREVSRSGPYMHNGGFDSLELVVYYYNIGGYKNPWLDPRMQPLDLTEEEQRQLVDFLYALSGEGWQDVKPPTQFPQ